jgi:hypothetical protein
MINVYCELTCLGDFADLTDQPEACDVGHGMNSKVKRRSLTPVD